MTGLLVSVRDAAEATLVAATDVAIIDVKEPLAGALGAASTETLADVARVVAGRKPLSAALGELRDDAIHARCRTLPNGYSLAKIGLAGMATEADWRDRWHDALRNLPPDVEPVAVAYADWQTAASPPPHEVLAVGHHLGCRALLVDTFDKRRGRLFEHLDAANWHSLFSSARCAGLLTVAAGSLTLDDALRCAELGIDLVGARGALCVGSRESALSVERVEQWLAALAIHSCDARTLPAAYPFT